ncbi:MAG: hypothetical protein JWP91_739 [Fibrobacteres bacterium]|nr:hypothetical protein [Fibrobacterota bacterium]
MSPFPPFLIRPFPEWEGRVRAAFTTRHAGGASTGAYSDLNLGFRAGDDPESVSSNWNLTLAAAGLAGKTLVLPRMVHGDSMADADLFPDPAETWGKERKTPSPVRLEPAEADALCSGSSARALAVTMADCLTALVFDPQAGTIAAVHAGWRGTHAHILEKALRALAASGRICPDRTLVAFGPCLRVESLEVGAELACRLEPEFVVRKDGRFHFDMPASNRAQALAAGIPSGNIRDCGGDTLREPERYFSYRRDGQASGRMAAFISLV